VTEKGRICRVQVPSLYCSFFKCWSDSSQYVCLSEFFLWLQGEASSYVSTLHMAWVVEEEAKWIYSQSKWSSGKSGHWTDGLLKSEMSSLWKRWPTLEETGLSN